MSRATHTTSRGSGPISDFPRRPPNLGKRGRRKTKQLCPVCFEGPFVAKKLNLHRREMGH